MTGSSGLLDDVGQLLELTLGPQESTQLLVRKGRSEKVEVEGETGRKGGKDQMKDERKTDI